MVNPNNGSESQLTMASCAGCLAWSASHGIDGMILYPSFVRSVPDAFNLPPIMVDDKDAGYRIGRPVVTAGHQPAAERPRRGVRRQGFAQRMGLHVGQTFHYVVLTPALLQQLQPPPRRQPRAAVMRNAPATQQGTARIDGIGVTQDGVDGQPGICARRVRSSHRRSAPRIRTR